MSDCSTEAMKPKEQPKTCGNCDSWRTVGIERGYCILDNELEDGCAKLHLRNDPACDKHTDAPLPIEQRCQQLEQVALEMMDYMILLSVSISSVPEYAHIKSFREKLEALGVSADE